MDEDEKEITVMSYAESLSFCCPHCTRIANHAGGVGADFYIADRVGDSVEYSLLKS